MHRCMFEVGICSSREEEEMAMVVGVICSSIEVQVRAMVVGVICNSM